MAVSIPPFLTENLTERTDFLLTLLTVLSVQFATNMTTFIDYDKRQLTDIAYTKHDVLTYS